MIRPSDIASFSAEVAPHKAVLSEAGWLFLINDTNDFLRVYFGLDTWKAEQEAKAIQVILDRTEALRRRSIPYVKFIVPEKPVVYPEYLPVALRPLPRAVRRPAHVLAAGAPSAVSYLDRYLESAKGLGHLYFRGDTHTNWLGSWLVYRFIIHRFRELGLPLEGYGLDLAHLEPNLATYEGDLPPHLSEKDAVGLRQRFGFACPPTGLEHTVLYRIPDPLRQTERVRTPADYEQWYDTRETFVFERRDGLGPTAVVFRDSTFDRGVMELVAEHFARSVFVWHSGLVDESVLDRERPHVVMHSMAERFVTRYPSFPPLHQAAAVSSAQAQIKGCHMALEGARDAQNGGPG